MEKQQAIATPQITEESIQKELADLASRESGMLESMKAYKKNIFNSQEEADKFLDTPEAKEKNMELWVVRKDGKNPCFMVDTPDRIKAEKSRHDQFQKLPESSKMPSLMMEAFGMVMGFAVAGISSHQKKKFLELKLEYVKALFGRKPSNRIISILKDLSSISHKRAHIMTWGTRVYIWLHGVRRKDIRQDLDIFDIKVSVFLKVGNHNKVRHCSYEVYPSTTYSFSNGRKIKEKGRIEFPWKTGFPGDKTVRMIKCLKKSIEYLPKTNEGVRILYAATSMPKLRKVIPEVEQFLGELYSQLFRMEDYADWTPSRIRKTLSKVLKMKRTLDIPEEKPLAIGVDETSRVINAIINALRKWIVSDTWKIPRLTKAKQASLLKGRSVNVVNPPNGYRVRVLPGATHYKLIKSKI